MDQLPKELHVDWRFGSEGIVSGRYNISQPSRAVQRLWVMPAGERERGIFGEFAWQIDTWCVGWRRWNLGRRGGYGDTREEAQDAAVQMVLRMVEEGAAECGCCIADRQRRERNDAWLRAQCGVQAI